MSPAAVRARARTMFLCREKNLRSSLPYLDHVSSMHSAKLSSRMARWHFYTAIRVQMRVCACVCVCVCVRARARAYVDAPVLPHDQIDFLFSWAKRSWSPGGKIYFFPSPSFSFHLDGYYSQQSSASVYIRSGVAPSDLFRRRMLEGTTPRTCLAISNFQENLSCFVTHEKNRRSSSLGMEIYGPLRNDVQYSAICYSRDRDEFSSLLMLRRILRVILRNDSWVGNIIFTYNRLVERL